MTDLELLLLNALKQADIYLNHFDVSPPSRVKAETRLAVEEAMSLLRPRQ